MKIQPLALLLAAGTLLPAVPASSQTQGQGQAVVTVLPRHDGEVPSSVAQQDLAVKLNGKNARVTRWAPLQSPENKLELVILLDSSSRTSLGSQLDELAAFIKRLPPNTVAAIAYMESGRAALAGPLTADHAQILAHLHLPGGGAGSNASPYFCLSDLAQHWPSTDRDSRREVLMVTDGVDPYNRTFDPDDTYVQSAIADSVRARLVVFSIFWRNQGRADNAPAQNNAGQSLLQQVSQATGGKSFGNGFGNPVSFEPFLDELTRRLRNQYELRFTAPLPGKPDVETLKLKLVAPGTEIDAPQQVYVYPATPAPN